MECDIVVVVLCGFFLSFCKFAIAYTTHTHTFQCTCFKTSFEMSSVTYFEPDDSEYCIRFVIFFFIQFLHTDNSRAVSISK